MKIIKVKGQDLSIPESWEETNLSQWAALSHVLNKEYINDEALCIDILAILCKSDLVSEMPVKVFQQLMDNVLQVFLAPAVGKSYDHFNIDGIDYAWIDSYDNCTLNEVSTIKQRLEAASKEDPTGVKGILEILPILLRPAKLKDDVETKTSYWELDTLDVKNLEYRRELFMERLSIVQIEAQVRFFFNGINK